MFAINFVDEEKELEHCSLQELDKRLEQKEANVWFLNALHASFCHVFIANKF